MTNSLIFYLVNVQTYFPGWFSERMTPTKVVNIGIKYLSFMDYFHIDFLLKVFKIIGLPDLLYS